MRNTPFPSEIINLGTITVTGNVQNYSDTVLFANDSLGRVILNGSAAQLLMGEELNFYDLELDNNSGVTLQTDISVNDTLLMTSGSIDLNGRIIEMVDSIGEGILVNETEDNRIFGSSGFIQTTRDGNDGGNLAGLGLRLDSSAIGRTTLRRGHGIQTGSGDGSIERYFVVEPTFSPIGIDTVEFNYFDAELAGISELDLDIYVSADSMVWRRQEAQNSPMGNFVMDSVELSSYEFVVTLAKSPCNVPPAVNIPEDTIYVCDGDSVLLDTQLPSSGYEFIWSTGATDSAIYESGTNAINVMAIDDRGCIGYDTVQVIWSTNPYAEFTVPNNCLNDSTIFTNNDTVAAGNTVAGYFWDFGVAALLNDTSDLVNPGYVYGDSGVYMVWHWVVNDKGCVDSTSGVVQISNNPVANFSYSDDCADSSVLFLDLSATGGPAPAYGMASYDWDFGNSFTSTSAAPSAQTYASAGSYPVTLIVRNSRGCYDTLVQSITIHPNPVADFTWTQVCGNETTVFTNSSTNATSYAWDLGNSSNSSSTDPSVEYGSGGVYSVVLTSYGALGCSDSTVQSVQVDTLPTASFLVNNACADDTVFFSNTSFNPAGTPAYQWDFGDASGSTDENPFHTYALDGAYTVELISTGANGCVDTAYQSVTIHPLPDADFFAADACADSAIQFTNNSSISSGTLSFGWEFGDGATSNATDPVHSYSVATNYQPVLIAISAQGCRDTLVNTLNAFDNPIANLGGSITTCGSSMVLDASNTGSAYLWNDLSTNQTLPVTLDGTYWVQITSPDGCVDSDTAVVTLNVAFNLDLGSDTTVCDSLELSAYTPGGTYTWNTAQSDSAIWAMNSGTYYVDVIDQNSCAGTDTIVVIVNYSPVVELGNDTTICASETLVLDAQNPGATISWNNGASSNLLSVDSTFDYHVTVTSPASCSTIDSIYVVVNPNPSFSLGADTAVCDLLTLSVQGLSGYLWSTGSTDTSIVASSTGTFWLEGGNAFGCLFTDSVDVTVFPSPDPELGNDTTLCYGASLVLDAGSAASYLWNTGETGASLVVDTSGTYSVFVSSGTCTSSDTIQIVVDSLWSVSLGGDQQLCENELLTLVSSQPGMANEWYSTGSGALVTGPTLDVSVEDTFWVIATNGAGCAYSDTIVVTESTSPLISDFLVATEIHLGDTVQFVTVTTDSITSYFWDFGDGTSDTARHPYHEYFFVDTFDVMLVVSNGYCTDTLIKQVIILPGKSVDPPFVFPVEGDETSDIENVWVYPNPTSGHVTLEILLSEEKEVDITLFDLYGRLISTEQHTGKYITATADMQSLRAGMYFATVRVGLEARSIRIVKQ